MVKVNHLVARAPSRGVYSAIFHNKYLEILKIVLEYSWKTPRIFFHPNEWEHCDSAHLTAPPARWYVC